MTSQETRYRKREWIQSQSKTTLTSINDIPFEDEAAAPIGDYPRIKAQWTNLKNPTGYWDQQGRRNYGEIVHDMDNFTDIWGIGAEQSTTNAYRVIRTCIGFIAVIAGCVYAWNPSKRTPWVSKFNFRPKKIILLMV